MSAVPSRPTGTLLHSAWDSDIAYSFRNSPVAIIASIVFAICLIGAMFAPWLAPHNPFDLKTLNLLDALTPPSWLDEGKRQFLLGTDDQGRDLLSAIMFGSRVSLLVGIVSVLSAMLIGVSLGLLAGYAGGKTEAFIMRVADVQLSFPAILIALLISGVARTAFPSHQQDRVAVA